MQEHIHRERRDLTGLWESDRAKASDRRRLISGSMILDAWIELVPATVKPAGTASVGKRIETYKLGIGQRCRPVWRQAGPERQTLPPTLSNRGLLSAS